MLLRRLSNLQEEAYYGDIHFKAPTLKWSFKNNLFITFFKAIFGENFSVEQIEIGTNLVEAFVCDPGFDEKRRTSCSISL